MLLGSGAMVGTIAMPNGPSNPEISEEFTVAPEVVYSPIVLAKLPVPKKFVTKMLSARAVLESNNPSRAANRQTKKEKCFALIRQRRGAVAKASKHLHNIGRDLGAI